MTLAIRSHAVTALQWLPLVLWRAGMRVYLDVQIWFTLRDIAYVDYEMDFARRTLPLKKRGHRKHLSDLRYRRAALEND